jgi:hypothetical protein
MIAASIEAVLSQRILLHHFKENGSGVVASLRNRHGVDGKAQAPKGRVTSLNRARTSGPCVKPRPDTL